ncbi:hypothetical protein EL18_02099 [Nitratireductor basaltis]|uniref:Uncharacterized protein n=1 Tax=Nitratireductor basaltis TaxID=472175 RepID=A0A084UDM1_9HYPH|nr:hypothetical protein EL18_02099 [Nitratireductor basaltis]
MAWLVAYLYLACGSALAVAAMVNSVRRDEPLPVWERLAILIVGPLLLPLAAILAVIDILQDWRA